jgi:hypothetical protein
MTRHQRPKILLHLPPDSRCASNLSRGAKRQRGLTADDLAAQALIMMVSHVSPLKQPMQPPLSQPASLTLPPISLLLSGNDKGAASSTSYHRESSSSASAGSSSSNASCSPKTTPSSPMHSSATGTAAGVTSSSIGRPCMTKRSQPKAAASKPKSVFASQHDRYAHSQGPLPPLHLLLRMMMRLLFLLLTHVPEPLQGRIASRPRDAADTLGSRGQHKGCGWGLTPLRGGSPQQVLPFLPAHQGEESVFYARLREPRVQQKVLRSLPDCAHEGETLV